MERHIFYKRMKRPTVKPSSPSIARHHRHRQPSYRNTKGFDEQNGMANRMAPNRGGNGSRRQSIAIVRVDRGAHSEARRRRYHRSRHNTIVAGREAVGQSPHLISPFSPPASISVYHLSLFLSHRSLPLRRREHLFCLSSVSLFYPVSLSLSIRNP
ncbi:hypothetical protein HanXRQr2_Chr02g0051611 [Helianthus annuus]|uniref:Uncharacterized protein n=1 Tax=Helianthus annuus TaxID=4232 RepID=A0A9K3JMK0_HELAN|nr:hypothetical protein HanXRQr2_Chr02g0051611 [Helianthus annuus]KAJ0950671.1 hypothetical protein HanPSC8_Chr02g0051011 [Helianthus annuus]